VFFTTMLLGAHYNDVLWTIHIEFLGSMLVFALVYLFINYKKRRLLYYPLVFIFSSTYYMAFILGLILSDIYNSEDKARFRLTNITVFIALSLGLFLGSYSSQSHYTIHHLMTTYMLNDIFVYYSFGAALIMLALLNSEKLQLILNNKYLVFLGKISFSVYLLHKIIMHSFSCWLFIQLYNYMSYTSSFMITFIVSMVLIIGMSYMFYLFIDLNGIRLSKWIYERISKIVIRQEMIR
jgi:peptidoglycan/LPS O-acetylase OafA/YrhL